MGDLVKMWSGAKPTRNKLYRTEHWESAWILEYRKPAWEKMCVWGVGNPSKALPALLCVPKRAAVEIQQR
jgi:hypothetical protein